MEEKKKNKILAVNPGSTSTKIGVYEGLEELFTENVVHSDEELKKYDRVADEFDMRRENISNALKSHGIEESELAAVVGRGGQLVNIHAGGYLVTEDMKRRLLDPSTVEHASN